MSTLSRNNQKHFAEMVWVMRKINTPLSLSAYPTGASRGKEFFLLSKSLSTVWYEQGDIYFDPKEIERVREQIQENIHQNSAYPSKVYTKVQKIARRIQKQRTSADYLQSQSLEELIDIFKKSREPFLDMIGCMSYRGSVQMAEVLESQVNDILIARGATSNSNVFDLVKTPIEPSVLYHRQMDILHVAKGLKKMSPGQEHKAVKKFITTYNWLTYHWFIGNDLTSDDVLQEISAHTATAKFEISEAIDERKKAEKELRDALRSLGLRRAEKEKVKQLRTWIYGRTYIKDMINFGAYTLLPILEAIARKIGAQRLDMVYMTLDEIDALAGLDKENQARSIAESRKRNPNFNVFIAGDAVTFVKERPTSILIKDVFSKTEQNEVRGSIAMKGKVAGVARVITDPKEVVRVLDGDILVTGMTTPDFLPAMKRAIGFVTDEGGITCHAAIVAREMKKPCVIGTKQATKVFKDGDMIEVDAEKGIVRKI